MESSENPVTPAALRRHVSLASQCMPKLRQKTTHLRSTKRELLTDSNGPKGPVHDFNGFLGPSMPQGYEACSEASDNPHTTRRRTQDINALSHALRQCRQKENQFPPIQTDCNLRKNLRLAMEKTEKNEAQEESSDFRHRVTSPNGAFTHFTYLDASKAHHAMANIQGAFATCTSPPSSPHRATSPPFKTRIIREMLPTIPSHQGMAPKADAYKRGYHTAGDYSPSTRRTIDSMDRARCDLILLPTNQKLSIQEITVQTDRYKQIAGRRTFSIQFDTPPESSVEEPYQRRPYLLQRSPAKQRRAPSPAAFNAALEEMQSRKTLNFPWINGKNIQDPFLQHI